MATKKKKATAADELLRGLAQTKDDEALVAAILAKAKVGAGTIKVGKTTVQFGPPADPDDYADWPASFRELIAKTTITIADSLVIGVDADGGLDSLKYLTKGTELEGKEADVRCPVEQVPNWWIYHPLDRAPGGEPRLRFLDHGGGNFSKEAFDHIGSLALDLIADALGVEAAPATVDDRELVVKPLGKLHKSVNDARVRGKVLFTLERPMKKELWGDYPDAVSRIAAYDLTKPSAPALLSFLPTVGTPARMALDGDHLIVLTVDWKASTFNLVEIDAADPSAMKVSAEIHAAKIPDNRNFNDCEKDSGVAITADGRLLVNYYFNHRELHPLNVFERQAGAWKHVSEHDFDGVERDTPFAEVSHDGKVVADADALWRLFDRHWARAVIIGERAVVSDNDDGTALYAVDRAGKKSKPVKLSKDGLDLGLTVMDDYAVVSSMKGVNFLRVLADGSLVNTKALKRGYPKEVIWTGGYLLINERFDKAKPVAKGFCLEICSVT